MDLEQGMTDRENSFSLFCSLFHCSSWSILAGFLTTGQCCSRGFI